MAHPSPPKWLHADVVAPDRRPRRNASATLPRWMLTLATAVVAIGAAGAAAAGAGRPAAVPAGLSGGRARVVDVGHRVRAGRGARHARSWRPCRGSRRRCRPPSGRCTSARSASSAIFISLVTQPARARRRGARPRRRRRPPSTRRSPPGCAPCCGARVLIPLTAFVAASWWGYERARGRGGGRGRARRDPGARPGAAHLRDRRADRAPRRRRRRAATTRRCARARPRSTRGWPTWWPACPRS